MCGITGWANRAPIDPQRFLRAHERLRHRGAHGDMFIAAQGDPAAIRLFGGTRAHGPDERPPQHIADLRTCNFIAGHHLLKVCATGYNGHSPLATADERYWLLYNGEIYNHLEVRRMLPSASTYDDPPTDTSTLLRAWVQFGADVLPRLNGMWAFAMIDATACTLTLCRDRYGVKPLYYRHDRDGFAFGSEPKFLLGLASASPDTGVVGQFLVDRRADHTDRTFWREIRQVPPGGLVRYDLRTGSLHTKMWWLGMSATTPQGRARPMAALAVELSEMISSAIDLRTKAAYPVGLLLSGGIDSSLMVTSMASRGALTASTPVFSVVATGAEPDEEARIQATLAAIHSDRAVRIPIDSAELIDSISRTIDVQGAPFRSPAVVAQGISYERIRQMSSVVAVLGGTGADECFGGYRAHGLADGAANLLRYRPVRAFRVVQRLARLRPPVVDSGFVC